MPSPRARRCTASSCARASACTHSWYATRRALRLANLRTVRDSGSRYSRGQRSQPPPSSSRRGELDQRAQIAEVADAPVALGAHPVELQREAPDAPALRQQLRLVAPAALELDLGGLALRSERLRQPLARLGVDALLAPPDVE